MLSPVLKEMTNYAWEYGRPIDLSRCSKEEIHEAKLKVYLKQIFNSIRDFPKYFFVEAYSLTVTRPKVCLISLRLVFFWKFPNSDFFVIWVRCWCITGLHRNLNGFLRIEKSQGPVILEQLAKKSFQGLPWWLRPRPSHIWEEEKGESPKEGPNGNSCWRLSSLGLPSTKPLLIEVHEFPNVFALLGRELGGGGRHHHQVTRPAAPPSSRDDSAPKAESKGRSSTPLKNKVKDLHGTTTFAAIISNKNIWTDIF